MRLLLISFWLKDLLKFITIFKLKHILDIFCRILKVKDYFHIPYIRLVLSYKEKPLTFLSMVLENLLARKLKWYIFYQYRGKISCG